MLGIRHRSLLCQSSIRFDHVYTVREGNSKSATSKNQLPPHRFCDAKVKFNKPDQEKNLPRSRIYPLSPHKLQKVKEYLDEQLQKGFIVPSQAPFLSPVPFAERANGGLRFCVDYRGLNQFTRKNKYPISLVNEVLGRVQGCEYLTRLGIVAAFSRIRMHPESEDYTTCITPLGAYKFRSMFTMSSVC